MIVGITYEGGNSRKGEKEVKEFLKTLSSDRENDYYVGVDYASKFSEDHTAITYCTKDNQGNFIVKGSKSIS